MSGKDISGLGIGWDEVCDQCKGAFRCFSKKQKVCSEKCRFDFYRGKGSSEACWEWTGPRLNGDSYGVMFLNQNKENGRRMVTSAHRYAYAHEVGEIPSDLCVMHTCDNPPCTNPAHLRLGTRGENNTDRSQKGRSGSRIFSDEQRAQYSERFRGARNKSAKLTDEDARFIKYAKVMTIKGLMAKFGISKSVISHIRLGLSWKHI